MSNPLISIVVPCYKQAHYLDEALQSVLNQSLTDWECIIVNDGSPDNTKEVSEKWIAKDSRFRYLNKENGGLSSARNYGINQSKSDYILPLDADDRIAENYLKLAILEFEKNKSTKVVYCKAEKFGEEYGMWNLPVFSLYTLSRTNCIFCSAVFRKKDWELVGGYDVQMKYGWEDWEFWISLLKDGGDVKQLDYIGFFYRIKQKSNSMLQSISKEKEKYLYEYLSSKHANFFVKYYGSFMELEASEATARKAEKDKLKSKKFVLNTFFKTFFGFIIFKNTSF